MAFTRGERVVLTVAYSKLREQAERDGAVTEFDGAFFDSTDAQKKASLLPEVTKLRDQAQAELNAFTANQATLQQRVTVLNNTMAKLV